MDIEVDIKMKTKPPIDREEKLHKVEERLLSNKTYVRFTTYDGVMTDNDLSLPQKVIHLQRAIDNVTRRKIYYASLLGQLHEKCFFQSKKVYKKTLDEMKIAVQWSIFLRKVYKLILKYSELQFCTVSLRFFCSNFKTIEEICKRNKDRWK